MRRVGIVALLLVAAGLTTPAAARTIALPRDLPASGLGLELGFDPMLLAEIGYQHRLENALGPYNLTIGGATAAPLYLLKGGDAFEFTLGAALEIPLYKLFGVTLGLATSLATTDNPSGTFVAWGLDIAVLPGLYTDRWFLALHLGWRPTLATHVEHSALSRDAFDDRYPTSAPATGRTDGPEDGWYGFPSHRWVFGLAGGVTFGRRVSLYGGLGLDATSNDQGLFNEAGQGLFPFYGQLGVVIHW